MSLKCFDRGNRKLCIDRATGEQTWHEIDGEPNGKTSQPKGPSTLRRAANLTGAMARHVATGSNFVSLPVIQETFEICSNCPSNLFTTDPSEVPKPKPELKHIKVVGTCLHKTCGCYIHDTGVWPNKLMLESSRCPKGHWVNKGKELRK